MTSPKQIEANRANAARSTGPRTDAGKAVVSQNAVRHGLRAQRIVIEGESRAAFEDFRNRLTAEYAPADTVERLLVDRIAAGFWRLRRTGRIEAEMFDAMRRLLAAETASNTPYGDDLRFGDIISQESAASDMFRVDDHEAVDDESPFFDPKALPAAIKSMKQRFPHDWPLYECLSELQQTFSDLAEVPQDRHSIPAFRHYLEGLSELLSTTDDTQQQYGDAIDQVIVFLESLEQTIPPRRQPTLGKTLYCDFKGPDSLGKFTRYESQIERSLYKALHELQRLQARRQTGQTAVPIAVDLNITADNTP